MVGLVWVFVFDGVVSWFLSFLILVLILVWRCLVFLCLGMVWCILLSRLRCF